MEPDHYEPGHYEQAVEYNRTTALLMAKAMKKNEQARRRTLNIRTSERILIQQTKMDLPIVNYRREKDKNIQLEFQDFIVSTIDNDLVVNNGVTTAYPSIKRPKVLHFDYNCFLAVVWVPAKALMFYSNGAICYYPYSKYKAFRIIDGQLFFIKPNISMIISAFPEIADRVIFHSHKVKAHHQLLYDNTITSSFYNPFTNKQVVFPHSGVNHIENNVFRWHKHYFQIPHELLY